MSIRDLTGWILLAAALAFGVLAFYLMRGYLSSREDAMRQSLLDSQAKTTQVVVAKRNLSAGSVLNASTVAISQIPSSHVPNRVVYPRNFNDVKNRVLTRPLAAGETLLADFVSGLVVNRFSDLLEKGQRAVSLQVAALQNASGMLLPGDYVDLFVLVKSDRGSQSQLEPVLQRVKVLAAGPVPLRTRTQSYQHLPDRENDYSQITVGVSLPDAEHLVLARDAGDMVYLLRNAEDNQRFAGLDASFGSDNPDKYWYNSPAKPQGERRNLPIPSSGAAAESSGMPQLPEAAPNIDMKKPPKKASANTKAAASAVDNTAQILVGGTYADH